LGEVLDIEPHACERSAENGRVEITCEIGSLADLGGIHQRSCGHSTTNGICVTRPLASLPTNLAPQQLRVCHACDAIERQRVVPLLLPEFAPDLYDHSLDPVQEQHWLWVRSWPSPFFCLEICEGHVIPRVLLRAELVLKAVANPRVPQHKGYGIFLVVTCHDVDRKAHELCQRLGEVLDIEPHACERSAENGRVEITCEIGSLADLGGIHQRSCGHSTTNGICVTRPLASLPTSLTAQQRRVHWQLTGTFT